MKKLIVILAIVALAACTEPEVVTPEPSVSAEPEPTTITMSPEPSVDPTEEPSIVLPSPIPTPPKSDT